MQPRRIELSTELRDALVAAIKDTVLYKTFGRRHVTTAEIEEGDVDLWPLAIDATRSGNLSELQDAVSSVLIDHRDQLSPATQEEAYRLCDALTGMASGFEHPLVQLVGLPKSVDGYFIMRGLMHMTTNAKNGHVTDSLYNLKNSGENLKEHLTSRMHRDGEVPSIQAFYSIATGDQPATTAFADLDEVVDEVARHYRRRRDGTAMDVPVDAQLRAEVIDLLSMPVFDFGGWMEQLEGLPILLPESRHRKPDPLKPVSMEDAWLLPYAPRPADPAAAWPKPFRFHPEFGAGNHNLIGLQDNPQKLNQLPALYVSVNEALQSLKQKSDLVVQPGEVCFFNTSFLLHSGGRIVETQRTDHPKPRHAVAITSQMVMENARDHGFLVIGSVAPGRGAAL